jgi:4-amino-4-deoxy-L-arabinose transferase-like glycosyltransferase
MYTLKGLIKNKSDLLPILILIVCSLFIGINTVRDYGQSWDEADIYRYGNYAINAYRFFLHPDKLPLFDSNLNLYGPAYFMALTLFTRGLTAIYPPWSGPVAWHFCYFLTFLICIHLLYIFSRRWLSPGASFGTSLLFVSQPLFWGHAFINPKDLPFMAFFLASVYLGFEMVDQYSSPRTNYPLVAGAGIMLGLTVSFRSVGPLAGLLVGIYAIAKSPRKSFRLLAPYLALALITTYLTWPFLWSAPLLKFAESLETMSKFPFGVKVLFMGQFYPANELPWFYYPVLLGIQLTEPAIMLAMVGLGLAVRGFIRHNDKERQFLLLFIGWFLLPVILIVGLGSTLYDNGRQLFFLLPPVFLLIGLSLDTLINLLRSRWLVTGAVVLFMIPGIYASIKLHPYEYVYYNSFVGGTSAAYSQYEMDYWGTSYREVAGWLNEHAAANSTIWVTGPTHLLELYLRPGLQISCASEIDCGSHYDYVVTLVRWKAERRCRRADTVFSVARGNATFSIIRQLPPGKKCN